MKADKHSSKVGRESLQLETTFVLRAKKMCYTQAYDSERVYKMQNEVRIWNQYSQLRIFGKRQFPTIEFVIAARALASRVAMEASHYGG